MLPAQKQALKDILHLLVDKEQAPVLQELITKLPAPYNSVASLIFASVEPSAEKAEDGLIDSKLP